jgi:D-glycero-D-manno-heptose 1,7-bisphosphate phosphatase
MTLVDDIGLWCSVSEGDFAGRAALFIDRDGVLVEDTNYLGKPEDVRFLEGAASAIARCNRQGVPVVLITNQAGIGRGYYGWPDFHAVQEEISRGLAAAGARFDAALACAYHADAVGAYRVGDHPWRKPQPGMLLEATRRMRIDPRRSWVVGDRASDIQAGRGAGLAGGVILGATAGTNELAAARACEDAAFAVKTVATLTEAVDVLLAGGFLRP